MSTSRVNRLVLAAYPARFRDRYGDELATLVADCAGGWRVTFDLAVSAVKARLNPDPVISGSEGRRLRLETTTSTVFALWVWSTVAVALFARAVDDQPVPGLRSWGWGAYAVGNVVFSLSAAAILVVGFVYWLLVVVPAIRTKNRATLMPAVGPVAVVVLWLAGTGVLAVATHHIRPGNYRHITAQGPHTPGGWALLAIYALFTTACVIVCTTSIRRALRRAELTQPMLTVSSVVAVTASLALTAITACAVVCVTRVLMIGGIGSRDEITSIAAVCFLLLATTAAATSSVRGMRAVRAGPGA
ncbi:MAG: hypothetical protein M0Z30_21910 [Actinomycetota bacterium]|nr:hypothetical protein [Actinomycetota bacterium]